MIQGFIIGRLGAVPTTLKSTKGRDFKTFSVASDEFENGQKTTQWIRVSVFDGNLFKKVDALGKGSMVNIFGRIRINSYQDKNGITHAGFDMIASSVDFINTGRSNSENNPEQFSCGTLQNNQQAATASSASSDDIPF